MNIYTEFKNIFDTLRAEVERHIVGNDDLVTFVCLSVLTGLSTAAEGPSSTGKTRTMEVAAKASGLNKGMVVFSGDVLPSDITGNLYYDLSTGTYKVRHGVYRNCEMVIGDELNRASDRTWNALLDILSGLRTVIDGVEYPVSEIFTPLFAYNPPEYQGTRPLPEALISRITWSAWVGQTSGKVDAEISRRSLAGMQIRTVLDNDAIKSARFLYHEALKIVASYVHDEAGRITGHFKDSTWRACASARTAMAMVAGATAYSLALYGEASPREDLVRTVAYNCIRHAVEPAKYMSTADKEQLVKSTLLQAGVEDWRLELA